MIPEGNLEFKNERRATEMLNIWKKIYKSLFIPFKFFKIHMSSECIKHNGFW